MESDIFLIQEAIKGDATIKIGHVNAQSLPGNWDEFKRIFSKLLFDIIVVSETWFQKHHTNKFYSLHSYKLYRNDRCGKRGGGIAFYARDHIKVKVLCKSPSVFNVNQSEFILACVRFGPQKLLLGAIYRPPKASYPTMCIEELHKLLPSFNHSVIIGDVNIDLSVSTRSSRQLTLDMTDINLMHVPIFGTHHSVHSGSITTIDHCYVPSTIVISQFGNIPVSGLSQHDLIFVNYPVEIHKKKQKFLLRRNYQSINIQQLQEDADRADWYTIFALDKLEDKVNKLNEIVLSLFDKHAPVKKIRISKPRAPFITHAIKLKIKLRNKCCSLRRRFKNVISYALKFKSLRKCIK